MKKHCIISISLVFGFSFRARAAAGNTTDGVLFVALILAFLLLVLAFMSGADYLNHNGRKLLAKAKRIGKNSSTLIHDLWRKFSRRRIDLSYFHFVFLINAGN